METLAYLHLAVAYEETTDAGTPPVLKKLKLFEGLNWHKLSSKASIYMLSLALNLAILSAIASASAMQIEDRGAEVTALQNNLMAAKYYKGPVSGYYGKLTQAAVKRFQAANDLAADGIAGTQTLAALKRHMEGGKKNKTKQSEGLSVSVRGLRIGDRGSEVIEAQQRLKAAGFYKGLIDGKYGWQTARAVKRFQVERGLRVDGIVGKETWFAAGYLGSSNSPYLVVVIPESAETLLQVRQYVSNAYPKDSRQDADIYAGTFPNPFSAESQAEMLRSRGLQARVVYLP